MSCSLAGFSRSTLVLIFIALATAVLGSTDAGASTVSVNPAATWGTAGGSDGKAQLVLAIAESGGRVYLGGEFEKMEPTGGGGTRTRHHLAAIDVSSGELTSWDPDADGTVRAMAVSGNRLYIGGDFRRIGGKSARNLAAIDLATGQVDPGFRPAVSGRVRSLALDGGRLYLGGDFGSVGGAKRPKVAAVDAGTGAVLSWTPPALGRGRYTGQTGIPTRGARSGDVYSVAVSGGRVYAAGNFIDFAGQGGLLALDASTGRPLSQQWQVDRPVFALATSPGGETLFAAAGGPGGRLWAFRPDRGQPLWAVKVDGDAIGVAASGTTVYLAGHYDYIVNAGSSCYRSCPSDNRRRHLAAFDAGTGQLDSWNPTADTNTGPFTVTVGDGNLYVGGEFNRINGRRQPGFAQFPGSP